MTAPNGAVGALPGWRGTDPDGGTWVRTSDEPGETWPWCQVSDGESTWRTQEEAEVAGLVRLIPAVGWHYDEHGEDVVPDVEVDDAAPAPLDPGNPEDWRRVVAFVETEYALPGEDQRPIALACAAFLRRAEQLDRERAAAEQAEQDASDRKRAEAHADREFVRGTNHWSDCVGSFLAGMRAERARQETGQ